MAKLPKARFNLKHPKSDKETLIFLIFNYRGKRLYISTGYTILPSEWDFQIQRPFEIERRFDLFEIRKRLDDYASYCRAIYIESDYGAIGLPAFKEQLKTKTDPIGQDHKRPTFFEFIEEEVEEMKASGMKKASYGPYTRHGGILEKFAKERGYFEYEDVDWNWRLELIDWLSNRNVSLGYGNKTLSITRQFLERARRKKIHSNIKYQGDGWLVTQKKAIGQKIVLNLDELQRLANLNLFGQKAKARDLFLIGAGTGQRFSDFSRYTQEHFYTTMKGIPILSIISQKTDTPAKIPLNIFPWLVPILEKNEYRSPKMHMQKLNDIIKDICKEVQINEDVLIVEQYMGRKARVVKRYAPKHEEISSHTCRRSFATNLYRMGYSLGQIMPMTGHATEVQLREYIGIDAEENAEEIALSILKRRQNKD